MASRFRRYMDKKAKWYKRFVVLFSWYLFAFGIYLLRYHLKLRSLSDAYDRDFTSRLLLLRESVVGILLASPFVAAYAVYRDNRTFYVFLTLVLGAGFAVQFLYHFKNHVEQEQILQHLIKVDLIAKFEQLPADDQRAIEAVQQKETCCGVFGWQDYGQEKVPSSCCGRFNETSTMPSGNCELDELRSVGGCTSRFDKAFRDRYFNYDFYQAALIFLISFQLWINVFSLVLVLYGGRKEEPVEPLPGIDDVLLIVALG